MIFRLLIGLVTAFAVLPAPAGANERQTVTTTVVRTPVVMTSSGPITGIRAGRADRYLGIPYAAPPSGPLRWMPPVLPRPWTSPHAADAFRGWCLQVAPAGFSKPTVNEDCLYLNVFTPRAAPARARKRPVMVWIHGGGLRQGRSDDYDPTTLVERGGVVFVTLNYRLGILGFLAHPSLDREGHVFANYGLLDQQFALTWVKRNIAAFGGDPENVTLIGESSGGANVFDHMASPGAAGLFSKAIVQSGSLWYSRFAPFYDGLPLDGAEEVGRKVGALAGCTTAAAAACLRSLPAERLAEVARTLPSYSFGVVVDGAVLDRTVGSRIASGEFHRVPVINGSNRDEWTWVEGLGERATGRPLTGPELEKHLEETFGSFAAKAAPVYLAAAGGGSAGAASARAVTDGLFSCPLLALNTTLSRYVRVWGFEFADRAAPYPFPMASFPYGAAHTLEMQYLFKNYTGAVGVVRPLSPAQRRLSDRMIRYWTTFAAKGDPNGGASLAWPYLSDRETNYLALKTPAPTLVIGSIIGADHKCGAVWR